MLTGKSLADPALHCQRPHSSFEPRPHLYRISVSTLSIGPKAKKKAVEGKAESVRREAGSDGWVMMETRRSLTVSEPFGGTIAADYFDPELSTPISD